MQSLKINIACAVPDSYGHLLRLKKGSRKMAEFTIDGNVYDTEKLDDTQKRVIALYQQALKDESEAVARLEISRAARVELGRKLKELVIETSDDTNK